MDQINIKDLHLRTVIGINEEFPIESHYHLKKRLDKRKVALIMTLKNLKDLEKFPQRILKVVYTHNS